MASDAAPAAKSSYEVIELAKSGRSTCKKCGQPIEQGSLRVGKCFADEVGDERKIWYHPGLAQGAV